MPPDNLVPLSRSPVAPRARRPSNCAMVANMFATHLADPVATFAVFAAPLPPATPANPLELRAAAGDAPMKNQKAAKTAMLTAALNFLPSRPGKGDRLRRVRPPACGEPVRQLHVDTLSATQIQCPVAFLAGTTAFPCTRTRGSGARHRVFRALPPPAR